MRLLDPDPIDPEIIASLDAIDATLAGEPVDAQYAELAEIALLLASDRPQTPPAFAQTMDDRVRRRFAPASAPPARRRLTWARVWPTMTGVATALALCAAIVVVASNGGGGSSESSSSAASPAVATSSSPTSSSAAGSSAGAPPTVGRPSTAASNAHSATGSQKSAATSAPAPALAPAPANPSAGGSTGQFVQPPTTGRKVVQSAQIDLSAAPNRIDAVAQELYNVVGAANGIVNNSSVTQGGPSGYAQFQLSVPSSALGQTLTKLSELTYAQVVSRTDASQDITDQYGAATRSLADARALRTSLLKQLANATTTEQVNSLTAQIHDAEASISSDEATVARLNHQVNYSQVEVEINAQSVPFPVAHKSGFTLGRASHDAGRVLMVTAGVGLIALAALLPVALIVALAWWVGSTVRRRRRDQVLDLV